MSWNYRIIKKPILNEKNLYYYFLAEVFYKKDGSLMAYSEHEIVTASSKEEIIDVLKMMLKDAKSLPAINEKEFYTGKKK